MNKVIAFFAVVGALSLAGCGSEAASCSGPVTEPAPPANKTIQSCTLQTGAQATLHVQLCPSCADTNPHCQAEFNGSALEVNTTFYTCDETRSCAETGSCGFQFNSVTCSIIGNVPAPGAYDVQIIGDKAGNFISAGTVQVVAASGSTSCSI
ncbi:hypothetical protein [Anaeromyxobacter paludicola]|uniref:Lipoprotein n=1 Tax=Anaeromyxobacter paludicola TaxID=2918171 RepID=A0ABM7XFY8_9BACT|nr:hypothetical protein [Anaeromyxobacter paludicola]BDG10813.1 hypothetical protein AMPC_39260 [Anaeromyxobacter paludicola]